MDSYWLLLLPVAASVGYMTGFYKKPVQFGVSQRHSTKTKETQKGLNYLLSDHPDKSLDYFVNLLNVDNSTIETHLALGNLFRRRGEMDRAIRIHENLIGQPQLNHELRTQALVALAKDYLSAGVLDRAERLFLELVDLGAHLKSSYQALLYIYQQEKEWQKAIAIAHKLAASSEHNMQIEIAQFYCELAEIGIKQRDKEQSIKYLKRALAVNPNCVRASLQLANLEQQDNKYERTLYYLKRVKFQNPDWLYMTVPKLKGVYMALKRPQEFIDYLKILLKDHPTLPIVVELSEQIRQLHGDKPALAFVVDYVKNNPSVEGLHDLLQTQLVAKDGQAREDLELLYGLTQTMLKDHAGYRCVNCGFSGVVIHWHCPSCKQWETTKPAYLTQDV